MTKNIFMLITSSHVSSRLFGSFRVSSHFSHKNSFRWCHATPHASFVHEFCVSLLVISFNCCEIFWALKEFLLQTLNFQCQRTFYIIFLIGRFLIPSDDNDRRVDDVPSNLVIYVNWIIALSMMLLMLLGGALCNGPEVGQMNKNCASDCCMLQIGDQVASASNGSQRRIAPDEDFVKR